MKQHSDKLKTIRSNSALRAIRSLGPCFFCCSAVTAIAAQLPSASFQGLGDLPGGDFFSVATGVADDGAVVVGFSHSASGEEAFRWTPSEGMIGLGNTALGGFMVHAAKVSSDGAVICGYGNGPSGTKALRWEGGIGTFLVDFPGAGQSDARAISADGLALAGYVYSSNGVEAYRWTEQSGMQTLGDLPGGGFLSDAYGVSDGGLSVVGGALSANGGETFLWTQNNGMEGLGDLPGGRFQSAGLAITPDGSVIVGYAFSDAGADAFRWTRADGMVGLGGLSGQAQAFGVSGDGSIVVGHDGSEAFIWDGIHGLRNLRSVLVTDYGLSSELDGWVLTSAEGISKDGSAITGYGVNPTGQIEGWIARVPHPNCVLTISCPGTITLPCSVDLLEPATFAVTASDTCDPAPSITYSIPPGSGFPVGTTTINCAATGSSGYYAQCAFAVTRAALGFTGFLAPIGGADATGGNFASPLRTFKLNSTIPIKFVANCGDSAVLSGIHVLQVVKYSDQTTAGDPIDATPTDAATTGDQFRLTDSQWQFNLDTKATGMTTGIWLLRAILSDGSQHSAWVQIK